MILLLSSFLFNYKRSISSLNFWLFILAFLAFLFSGGWVSSFGNSIRTCLPSISSFTLHLVKIYVRLLCAATLISRDTNKISFMLKPRRSEENSMKLVQHNTPTVSCRSFPHIRYIKSKIQEV